MTEILHTKFQLSIIFCSEINMGRGGGRGGGEGEGRGGGERGEGRVVFTPTKLTYIKKLIKKKVKSAMECHNSLKMQYTIFENVSI